MARFVIPFIAALAILSGILWYRASSLNNPRETSAPVSSLGGLHFPGAALTPQTEDTSGVASSALKANTTGDSQKSQPAKNGASTPPSRQIFSTAESPSLPVESPSFPISESAQLSAAAVYQMLDGAVVQIVCSRDSNVLVAGSGVIVSAGGIVLSNEHVLGGAEECIVKSGNPARIIGKLKILYMGDAVDKIAESPVPKEDFAFAAIIDLVDPVHMGKPFSFLKLDPEYIPRAGEGVYAAAYPTEFIGSAGLRSGGQSLVFTTTKVENLYHIEDAGQDTDIMELAGSITTQEGSSGSPIITPSTGAVIGLVFGETGAEAPVTGGGPSAPIATSERTELAFLIQYIDRVIQKDKKMTLLEFIVQLDTAQ